MKWTERNNRSNPGDTKRTALDRIRATQEPIEPDASTIVETNWDKLSDDVLEVYAATEEALRPAAEAGKLPPDIILPNGQHVGGVHFYPYDGAGQALQLRQEQQRIKKALARDLHLQGNPHKLPTFDPAEWQDYLAYLNKPAKEFPIARQSLLELSVVSTYVLRAGLTKGISFWSHNQKLVTAPLPIEVAEAIQVQFRAAKDGTMHRPDIGNSQKYERETDLVISVNRPKLYQALLNMPVQKADACIGKIPKILDECLTGGYYVQMAAGSRQPSNGREFYWGYFGDELEKEPRKKYFQVSIGGTGRHSSSGLLLQLITQYAERISSVPEMKTLNLGRYASQFNEDVDSARREKMHQLARLEPDSFEQALRMERLGAMAQLPVPGASKA